MEGLLISKRGRKGERKRERERERERRRGERGGRERNNTSLVEKGAHT